MHRQALIPSLVVSLACLLTSACGSAKGPSGADAAATTATAPGPTTTSRPPVLAAYDVVRTALADDNLAAAKTAAEAFAKVATSEAPPLTALAEAATTLAQSADIVAARAAIGTLSKTLIELLQDRAPWREGLLAFRCPMAKGYQKWIQLQRPMQNPYMGKEMLECGSKAELTP
jgi:Cu(I)/Ag(I) efflux system membrane fusion protein